MWWETDGGLDNVFMCLPQNLICKDHAENSRCGPLNSILVLFCFEFLLLLFRDRVSRIKAGLEVARQLQVTLNSLLELGVCGYTSLWELHAYECVDKHMDLDTCSQCGTLDDFLIYSLP